MKFTYTILLCVLAALATAIAAHSFRHAPQQRMQAPAPLNGPILYGINSIGQMFKVDVMNCTACPIANLVFVGVAFDLLVLPNGDILVQAGGLFRYTLPNPNPIWTDNSTIYGGSVLAPDSTIYLCRNNPGAPGLSTYDPVTNNVVFVGAWPSGMIVSEFFYQNGVLYGFAVLSGTGVVVEINTTDPGQSTVVHSGVTTGNGGTTNGGYTTAVLPDSRLLYQYNVSTNTFELICDLTNLIPVFGLSGLSDLPAGVEEAPCLCSTFAGTVSPSTFNLCIPGSVTVPYNNNATLDGNDILRYILFSDPGDTLGSIIVQSPSPVIAFNPATMQAGATYYLATLAGNNLNGNVDLNDPCLDISNTAAQVIWRPAPSVTLVTDTPTICWNGCGTVTFFFNGTPPFTLTYVTPAGTFTEVFPGSPASVQVCAPPGMQLSSMTVLATGLTDAWCDACN